LTPPRVMFSNTRYSHPSTPTTRPNVVVTTFIVDLSFYFYLRREKKEGKCVRVYITFLQVVSLFSNDTTQVRFTNTNAVFFRACIYIYIIQVVVKPTYLGYTIVRKVHPEEVKYNWFNTNRITSKQYTIYWYQNMIECSEISMHVGNNGLGGKNREPCKWKAIAVWQSYKVKVEEKNITKIDKNY